MAFKIKYIHPVLFKEIYTDGVAQQLAPFIGESRDGLCDRDDSRWAVDESRLACLLRTPLEDPKDSRMSYSFVWNGEVVLIQQQGVCRYRIVHASPMAQAKSMIQEALQKGGRYLRGSLETDKNNGIPALQFVGR